MLDPTFESGNKRSFSVWSLYKAVPSCLPYASEGVVLFMQITFLLFTMVFPALQLVVRYCDALLAVRVWLMLFST